MRLCCAVALVLKTLSLQGFESEDFNDNITVTLAGAGPTGPSGLHLSVQEIPSAHPKELITLRTHLASSVNAGDTGCLKTKKTHRKIIPHPTMFFFSPKTIAKGSFERSTVIIVIKDCLERLLNLDCHQRLPNLHCHQTLGNLHCHQRLPNLHCHQRLPNDAQSSKTAQLTAELKAVIKVERLPNFDC